MICSSGCAGAGAQSGERQRGAHEFQEATSVDVVVPFGGLTRKLPVKKFLELLGSRHFFQTSPVFATLTGAKALSDRIEIQLLLFATHR